MKRTIALMRISTEHQDEILQYNAISNYAQQNKMVIDEYLKETISGYSVSLEEIESIKRIKKMALNGELSNLLLYKQDRLHREPIQILLFLTFLSELNVRIFSATEGELTITNSESQLMSYLKGYVSQNEVLNLRKRVTDKMRALRENGSFAGCPPSLGYDVIDKKLVVNEEEAVTIKYIFYLYNSNGCNKIAQILNADNIKTKTGRTWTAGMIYKVLNNPIYIGLKRYNYNHKVDKYNPKKRHQDFSTVQYEPYNEDLRIIEDDVYYKAQEIMQSRRKRENTTTKNVNNCDYALLEGLMYHKCGQRLWLRKVQGYDNKYTYYCSKCSKNEYGAVKGQKLFMVKKYEKIIIDIILDSVKNIDINKLKNELNEEVFEDIEIIKHTLENKKKEIIKKKTILKNAESELEKYFLGESKLNAETINNMIESSRKTIEKLNTDIAQLEDNVEKYQTKNIRVEEIVEKYRNFNDIYQIADMRDKKLLLNEIVEKVTIGSKDDIEIVLKRFV